MVCPHCHKTVGSANKGICTNIGCGKPLNAPVAKAQDTRKPKQTYFRYPSYVTIH